MTAFAWGWLEQTKARFNRRQCNVWLSEVSYLVCLTWHFRDCSSLESCTHMCIHLIKSVLNMISTDNQAHVCWLACLWELFPLYCLSREFVYAPLQVTRAPQVFIHFADFNLKYIQTAEWRIVFFGGGAWAKKSFSSKLRRQISNILLQWKQFRNLWCINNRKCLHGSIV